MTHKDKLRMMKMAAAIHAQLEPERHATVGVQLPAASWQQCETLLRRMKRASHHGWQLSAARLQRDLRQALRRLHGELNDLDHQLESPPDALCRASISDIHADLVALHEEFNQVEFDGVHKTFSVTTEPIELESVYLGPFEIRLDWGHLATGHPRNYRVIALDAHPAATNDSVTHPHVQDEILCEGEGRQPIRRALKQGRLLDFFVIVANLLRTYNADSPHIALADWYGVECTDCGSTVCDDERWTCEKCETTVCSDCYFNCAGCDGIFCNQCVASCEGCDENHCGTCMKHCSRCDAELCQDCLDNKERCSDCHDQDPQQTREELVRPAGFNEPGGDRASVQPGRLGEAAVPA